MPSLFSKDISMTTCGYGNKVFLLQQHQLQFFVAALIWWIIFIGILQYHIERAALVTQVGEESFSTGLQITTLSKQITQMTSLYLLH